MNVSISVILTTCLDSHLLSKVITSILSQKLVNLELIVVVDNPSKFKLRTSAAIMDNSAATNFLVYQNSRNRGQAASLNKGIKAARFDFVAIADDDDYWVDQYKLIKQINYLNEYNSCSGKPCVAVSSMFYLNTEGVILKSAFSPTFSHDAIICSQPCDFTPYNPMTHSSTVFIKKFLLAVDLYDENLRRSQDLDLWLRLLSFGELHVLREKMIVYNLANKSLSKRISNFIKDLYYESIIWSRYDVQSWHYLRSKLTRSLRALFFKLASLPRRFLEYLKSYNHNLQ